MGRGPVGPVRLRPAAAGHVPVLGADLRRRSGGRAGRLRGDPRQRGPLHRRLRRVAAQRRRHRRKSPSGASQDRQFGLISSS